MRCRPRQGESHDIRFSVIIVVFGSDCLGHQSLGSVFLSTILVGVFLSTILVGVRVIGLYINVLLTRFRRAWRQRDRRVVKRQTGVGGIGGHLWVYYLGTIFWACVVLVQCDL